MVDIFARFIIKFRWPICIIVLLITAFLTYEATQISLPEELADIAPKGHPNVKLTGFLNEVFGVGTLVEIGVEVKEGTIFNKETIGKMHRIGEKIYDMRGVIRGQVVSIASHSGVKNLRTYTDDMGLSVLDSQSFRDLAKRVITEPDFMPVYRQTILNNEAIYGKLVSWDQKSAVIMGRFWDESEFKYIFQTLRKILKEEEDANHKFYLAGRVIEMGYLHKFMGYMVYLFGVAMAAIVVLLFLAFGTWRGIFMPMWAAFIAVSWGFGSEHLLGWKMDIMTIIVPFMIMAIEVSHCVQILNRFYEEYEKWEDKKRAAEETLRGLTIPSAASIITDGAGFVVLFFIPFSLIQHMAISASYGIVRIFFTTTVFIHAFLAVLPAPTAKEMERVRRRNQLFMKILGRVAQLTWNPRGRVVVFLAYAAVLVITIIGANKMEIGDMQEGSPLFWYDSEYNQAERLINNNFFGVNPYVIHIRGGKASALADPQLVRDVHNLKNHLEDRADVRGSSAYTEVLKGVNMAFHDNDPRWYILPNDYTTIWQFMDIFRTSGGPDDSKAFFEIDYSEAMLGIYVKDHRGSTIRDIIRDTDEYLKENQQSKYEFRQAAGLIGVFAAIMDTIRKGQRDTLILISVAVLVFISITFGSVWGAFLVIGVLELSNLILFGAMGFTEIGLFIYTVSVATLGLGLGDYAIYTVCRMQEERQAGKSPEEAHFISLTHAGTAVFFTGMSLTLGVLTLLLSAIRFQAIMGGMLAVVITANMLGALLLLPALMIQLKPKFLTGQ